MAILPWANNYSIEINKIDNQHKVLLDYLNKLYDGMQKGLESNKLLEIFDGLTVFAVSHFRTEEQLMVSSNYPDYKKHKSQHEELMNRLKELKQSYNSGEPQVAEESSAFLKNWLVNHILGSDKLMGKYLTRKGIH